MPKSPEAGCQARILDAAERAFAAGGYSGASMREIVRQAGVNLATVYYYFDSKRGLMDAVLKRRFDPLRREHLRILQEFQGVAKGRAVPLERILEAMLLPPLRLVAASPAKRQAITRLLGRIVVEPDLETQKILRGQRAELRTAFLGALQASLPQACPGDLQWRMEFVWGALGFMLCNPGSIHAATHAAGSSLPAQKMLNEMVNFFAAGFRASARARKPKLRPMAAA